VTRIAQKLNALEASAAPSRAEPLAHAVARSAAVQGLDRAVADAREALIKRQNPLGYWLFELEADCTIPAEYIMMMHFLDEIDLQLEKKLAVYLRNTQAHFGGWALYPGGDFNMSCTVKAYYALKLAGDDVDAPHMVRARAVVLERGGAARANVFTRIALALFGQLPWRGTPYVPVELMLLPKWFPFHLDKVAYWSRTVMVPLSILCTLRPLAKNPRRVDVRELFTTPPEDERDYFRDAIRQGGIIARAFLLADRLGRFFEPLVPRRMRERATRLAEEWTLARLNGEDGIGAIFPAMVNALEAMTILGYPKDDPRRVTAKIALQKLLVVGPTSAYCQPCVSPVWDTGLASLAMQEVGDPAATDAATRALDWLRTKQLRDEPGDWRVNRTDVAGGGWAFQFANPHYPDLDDTAVVVWAMHQAKNAADYRENVQRAMNWLVGMQSRNGGFAAFDADNTYYSLNKIPFADHGAMLDPPTSDVTGRVVTVLARIGRPEDKEVLARAIAYLRAEQEDDGSWFGRWGTNYIYGTWSVMMGLAQAGIGAHDPAIRRAVEWLKSRQNPDGGWGESNDTYARSDGRMASTPYQTAWALLALMSAGEVGSDVVRRGIERLLRTQESSGLWSDPSFTAPGFPRVFYLKYHGYSAYFPMWALAAYRSLLRRGPTH
jgi:squalene-hopene/tetraprenyl-beta-curcumene cyclase